MHMLRTNEETRKTYLKKIVHIDKIETNKYKLKEKDNNYLRSALISSLSLIEKSCQIRTNK